MAELLFRSPTEPTTFLIYRDGSTQEARVLSQPSSSSLIPIPSTNSMLSHGVVLFPSSSATYASDEALLTEVRDFIHRYVEVSSSFEEIAAHYVMFSWLYDSFREVPYLRVRGDYGTGKSRFLLTVGSLCYKGIFASGASTVSPLFRMLDAVRGTLVMDESDFAHSDERAEIVKILNNGNASGFPVLRSELSPKRVFTPRAFHVFGPKIIATRGAFADQALESRCITEEMGTFQPSESIPLNLPSTFAAEARELRNKLLTFRFRNFHTVRDLAAVRDKTIEPRIAQIFAPLLSTISSDSVRKSLQKLARKYASDMSHERSTTLEAQLLDAVWHALRLHKTPSIKVIALEFASRFGDDFPRGITPRWVGSMLRSRLSLTTHKSNGVFVLPAEHASRLAGLFKKYSVGQ